MDEGSGVLLGKYFSDSPGRGSAFTQWLDLLAVSHLSHKEYVSLKNVV